MSLRIWQWHSINLIPCVWLGEMYYDDGKTAQLIQFTALGMTVSIAFRSPKKVHWNSGVWGPLWSRRRKVWYRAPAK